MIRPICTLLLAAATLAAADKPSREIVELQRDLAQLGADLKTMRQSIDTRLAAMSTQIDTIAGAVAQVNTGLAAQQKTIAQIAQDQDRKVLPAIAGQAARLDQLASTLSTLQQAAADLTAAVNHLQTQVVDVGNAVKVIQSPAAPPQPAAADLLKAAAADKLAGKYDLALQEYSDFLKYYGDTPEADVALFELGMTHYARNDYDSAIRAFDALASKYSASKKLPDSLFYKAKSFQSLKRAADARAACVDLRKRFPAHDLAKQCPVARQ